MKFYLLHHIFKYEGGDTSSFLNYEDAVKYVQDTEGGELQDVNDPQPFLEGGMQPVRAWKTPDYWEWFYLEEYEIVTDVSTAINHTLSQP